MTKSDNDKIPDRLPSEYLADYEWLHDMVVVRGLSPGQVARYLDVDTSRVRTALEGFGIIRYDTHGNRRGIVKKTSPLASNPLFADMVEK